VLFFCIIYRLHDGNILSLLTITNSNFVTWCVTMQPLSVLPLSIWPWQETIKSLFSGKVTVVDVYPELTVRAVNMNVPLPSVIALTEYVKQPNQAPAFTRRNVFLRDGYKCQYCSKSFMTRDLSLDHVNPRCKGGRLEWYVVGYVFMYGCILLVEYCMFLHLVVLSFISIHFFDLCLSTIGPIQ
jgi:Restriction endonuclease